MALWNAELRLFTDLSRREKVNDPVPCLLFSLIYIYYYERIDNCLLPVV